MNGFYKLSGVVGGQVGAGSDRENHVVGNTLFVSKLASIEWSGGRQFASAEF